MSFPFGWINLSSGPADGKSRKRRPYAKAKRAAIDPKGRRLIGFTRETGGLRIRTDAGTLTTRLLVGADGAFSRDIATASSMFDGKSLSGAVTAERSAGGFSPIAWM